MKLSLLKTLFHLILMANVYCKNKFDNSLIAFIFRWMHYETKDQRDVFIYEFETKRKIKWVSFGKKDGLISHLKFLGDSLYYVKNTKDVIVKTKKFQLLL